jgi:hypothetical protein
LRDKPVIIDDFFGPNDIMDWSISPLTELESGEKSFINGQM